MNGAGARAAAALAVAASILAVVVPFFAATTFIGDDHLFLAYARYAPNPFVAFVTDAHGGEYYRPLPMLVWWVLGRAGGGSAPFAVLALALHFSAAGLVVGLLRSLGRPRPVAFAAGALMLLAPANLEAAYWFAASTDLFATVFVLGALLALVRGRPAVGAALALAGFVSKETALVLPVLALVVLGGTWRRRLIAIAPSLGLAALVLFARRLVLGGPGGSEDPRAGALAKALQIAAGFAHVFTGDSVLPEVLAFGVGTAIIALAVVGSVRRRQRRWEPWLFAALTAAPLVAAPWAVGARYFYFPAVGLSWATAEALSGTSLAAKLTLAAALVALGAVQASARRADVLTYDRRVAAARRAVSAGAAAGHRVFHVDGGIKDLDLVVKEDPGVARWAGELLVLNDVPASFAIVPLELAAAGAAAVAAPPIPPSGAYRFGHVRVVGLARRGDEPALDEVLTRFPDIRFLRLRPTPGGRVVARDLTDEVKHRLDGVEPDGQT